MKFRKKPVVIEAKQYDGGNSYDLTLWAHAGLAPESNAILIATIGGIAVRTLEGEMVARPGDWIIRGVKGEFYPCKPDIFAATYEPAEGASDLGRSQLSAPVLHHGPGNSEAGAAPLVCQVCREPVPRGTIAPDGAPDPLDQTVFQLGEEAYQDVQQLIDFPPAPTALKELMRSEPPWSSPAPDKRQAAYTALLEWKAAEDRLSAEHPRTLASNKALTAATEGI